MEFQLPPREIVEVGIRAMKTLALADGELSESERSLIATAQATFGTDFDLDQVQPIAPAELAKGITDPALRRQLVRGMTVLSLVDGEASPKEAAVVRQFAEALDVKSEDLGTLQKLADKQLIRARLDLGRRFWAREKMVETAKERGFLWVAKSLAVLAGITEDKALTEKYKALGNCPEGSLGRGYFDFITGNKFSFPGEKGSPMEPITLHDMTHVLGGYATDPDGELQVLAFHSGCRREGKDPFSFLIFAIVEFHLGMSLTPVAVTSKGALDAKKMFRALERGSKCTIDPTEGWDPWPVMNEQLSTLRERYHIGPA